MNSPVHLPHDWYPEPVPANVLIGSGSWLYSAFAFLHYRSQHQPAVRIGKSCGVYNGSFFDLGPDGEVEIGDFSTLVGVIVASNELVRIGNYCFLAHEVLIADASEALPPGGDSSDPISSGERQPSVTLGDDVWVGAGAVLLKGAHIGDGAIVGAAAVVDFEVPANAIVAGNPAKIVGMTRGRS